MNTESKKAQLTFTVGTGISIIIIISDLLSKRKVSVDSRQKHLVSWLLVCGCANHQGACRNMSEGTHPS